MTAFLNGNASNMFLPLLDTSNLSLADLLLTGDAVTDLYSTAGPTGWDISVSEDALKKYGATFTEECSPFIVGGVACNSGQGYKSLLQLKAVHKAWCDVAENKMSIDAFTAVASDTHESVKALVLPDPKTAATVMQRAIPTLIEHARDAKLVLETPTAVFLPDGLPGCLRDNYLLDGRAMLAKLVGSNLVVCYNAVEEMDDSLPQVHLINDAYSWYVEATKATGEPMNCEFDEDAKAAMQGVKTIVDAATRTNVSGIEPSTVAAVRIAEWRNS